MIWSQKTGRHTRSGPFVLGLPSVPKNKYNHNNPSINNKENTQRERDSLSLIVWSSAL